MTDTAFIAGVVPNQPGPRADNTVGSAFQQERPYLFAVAYRMTGSASDAEDLVQDAWIRYSEAGMPAVNSLRAYLTKIVSRLALDYLKSARVKREAYVGPWMPDPVITQSALPGPADTIEQREQVSIALLTLLERLSPDQRVVYVLREGFGIPYDEIATLVDRTVTACRQTHHRARMRLGNQQPRVIAPAGEHAQHLQALVTAVDSGDIRAVIDMLAEDAVWIADGGPDHLATRRPVHGADRVARGMVGFQAKVRQAGYTFTFQQVDLNGAPAIAVFIDEQLERIVAIDVAGDRITAIRAVVNPDKLKYLERHLATNRT